MDTAKHTHELGPGLVCHCGFKLVIPPIHLSLEISNGNEEVVSEGFNTDHWHVVADRLEEIAKDLRGRE